MRRDFQMTIESFKTVWKLNAGIISMTRSYFWVTLIQRMKALSYISNIQCIHQKNLQYKMKMWVSIQSCSKLNEMRPKECTLCSLHGVEGVHYYRILLGTYCRISPCIHCVENVSARWNCSRPDYRLLDALTREWNPSVMDQFWYNLHTWG